MPNEENETLCSACNQNPVSTEGDICWECEEDMNEYEEWEAESEEE